MNEKDNNSLGENNIPEVPENGTPKEGGTPSGSTGEFDILVNFRSHGTSNTNTPDETAQNDVIPPEEDTPTEDENVCVAAAVPHIPAYDESGNTGATRKFDTTGINNAGVLNDGGMVPDYSKNGTQYKDMAKKALKVTKSVFKILAYVLVTVLIIGILTGVFVGVYYMNFVKNNFVEDYDIVGLDTNLKQTSKIYYTNELGEEVEIESQRLHGTENRLWVSIYDMPEELRYAFIAIEDERFYEHNGMDVKRTLGAVMSFASGDSSYGGSTITQQLIKNFSGENDATVQRKITEIFRAISLTEKRSKDEVLEMYLNTINLSNGCHGVQAAANYLFGKDVSELNLVECAALAAIPKSPYQYNPKYYPEENKERRLLVLKKMKELSDDGKLGNVQITDEQYNEAKNAELVLNIDSGKKENQTATVYSYFTDALIEQLIADFNEKYGYPRSVATNIIFNGGLEIHTTVDPRIQTILEEAYADESTFYYDMKNVKLPEGIKPQSAMVIIDPYTGDVKGLVGGVGEKTESRGLNRATMSKRQVGSAIKPLTVYAPAVDLGYVDYATVIDDTPFTYNESMEKYWPENAGRKYEGYVNVNYGVLQSLNTTAVKTLDMITPRYSLKFAREKLGLENLQDSDMDYAPLALGGLTKGLTTLEMAGAYTIFPNDGVRCTPRLYTVVYDKDGNVLLENQVEETVAVNPSTAQLMTKMLENVLTEGTASKVKLKNKVDAAGKTGSTNSNKDLYFVGYTPYYVGACWFGYDEPKVMNYADNPAMVAWDKVMDRIHEEIVFAEADESGTSIREFSETELVKANYCYDSGDICTELCIEGDPRGLREREGWFIKGSVPTDRCTTHVKVDFCGVTNAIAGENCPVRDGKTVALVDVSHREFYTENLVIGDSEFGYRELPRGTSLADNKPENPYYSVLAPEGMFVGRPNIGYWRRPKCFPNGDVYYPYAYNRACTACDAAKASKEEEKPVEEKTEDIKDTTEENTVDIIGEEENALPVTEETEKTAETADVSEENNDIGDEE